MEKLIKRLKKLNYKIELGDNIIEILLDEFYVVIYRGCDKKYVPCIINYTGVIVGYNSFKTIRGTIKYIKKAEKILKNSNALN